MQIYQDRYLGKKFLSKLPTLINLYIFYTNLSKVFILVNFYTKIALKIIKVPTLVFYFDTIILLVKKSIFPYPRREIKARFKAITKEA